MRKKSRTVRNILNKIMYGQLLPLFAILGLGVGAAIFYPLRCALKSPDVSWNKKKNPEPWNDYVNKDYKFLKINKSKPTECPAPEY